MKTLAEIRLAKEEKVMTFYYSSKIEPRVIVSVNGTKLLSDHTTVELTIESAPLRFPLLIGIQIATLSSRTECIHV